MLKKQTVWLLTMLSLMIVLSVYYLTSPDNTDFAFTNDGQDDSEETTTDPNENDDGADVDDFTNLGQDELFTTIRMEVQNDRSKEIERLDDIVASSTATADEKNQALETIDTLDNRSKKELILEEMIVAAAGYQDVLVRYDESDQDKVHVHVNVEELSKTETVNIMRMVQDEFGDITVVVNFSPTAS